MQFFTAGSDLPRAASRVAETFSIPLSSLGREEAEDTKQCLTLHARTSFGPPAPPFRAWSVEDGRLHVPRFYGLSTFGPAEEDLREEGLAAPLLSFEGTLTDVQERATEAAFHRALTPGGTGGALISLPCGYGKTVWAVCAIARLGRRACIVVHKTFLRDQWVAALNRFCPSARIGHVQGKRCDVQDCDVVIAMIMTLAKRGHAMPDFGTVCFDECHHLAAPVMNAATRCFRARYIIGLTATRERPDGLTPVLNWCLGANTFHVEREAEPVKVTIALYRGKEEEILSRDGKPVISAMLNRIAADPTRNEFIVSRVAEMYARGRVILILSDRIAQLHSIHTLLVGKEDGSVVPRVDPSHVGIFTGKTKEDDRPTQLARRIVLCSYGMANEGLDKTEADTCVMATPKGRVTQCIGRVQRPCETKKMPLVLDIADELSIFVPLRWKRQKLYSKEKYQVQVVRVGEEGRNEWFE